MEKKKRKKIGILTYHSSHNYGAFLQAYSLCMALREKTGNEVELIDFAMQKSCKMNKSIILFNKSKISSMCFNFRRYRMFNSEIRKQQPISSEHLFSDDLVVFRDWIENRYDVIVVGSDEIWKLDGYRGFPNPYWLPDVKNCKKMSFAASSRTLDEYITEEMSEQIKEFLESFSYIGVRDEVTKKMVQKAINNCQEVYLNCDPTFLYDFHTSKDMGKYLLKKKFGVTGKKKCIALMCGVPELAYEIIRKYRCDFDIVCLYDFYDGTKGNYVLKPFEWMQVIAGADALITTFYHGMVFAIKNNTPFLAIENREINDLSFSKSYDLLKRNGLEKNFCLYKDNPKVIALDKVGGFLANVYSGSEPDAFSYVCQKEKELANSFLNQFENYSSNSIAIKDKYDCCGCGACATVCRKNAIAMREDTEGFSYPIVNKDACVDCGICKSVCSFNYSWRSNNIEKCPLQTFGIKHRDEKVRLESRSGGVFTAVSDWILEQGGAVYGAALDDRFMAIHRRAISEEDRNKFRGSKYVQSTIHHIYGEIKKDIDEGMYVLFSGTPCQVGAVKAYLKQEHSNMEKVFLVDIVCHGVPSPKVWSDYIDLKEKQYNGKITAVEFRNKKKYGWREHKETVVIDGVERDDNIFTRLFYSHNILRKSCYACPYKSVERIGDITIADFWGIEKISKEFDDNNGVSFVLVNNEQGEGLLEECRENLVLLNVTLRDGMQNSMKYSYPEPKQREQFWKFYKKYGLNKVIRAIRRHDNSVKVKRMPRRLARKMKNVLKKMLK